MTFPQALKNWITLLRPRQWPKNLVVFAGLIFSQHLGDKVLLLKSTAAFVIFLFLSSAVYVFNDLMDIESDRHHPTKSGRPLASGAISSRSASVLFIVLTGVSFGGSLFLSRPFQTVALGYFLLMIIYSWRLKRIVILDVLIVSVGFVLRAVGGTVVLNSDNLRVEISPWLLLCTLLLSLFLSLCKRRNELVLLQDQKHYHRKSLEYYDIGLLDQMISVVTSATLISYALYTISERTIEAHRTANLKFTIPLVLYGIFRYLFLVYRKDLGGAPEEIIFSDLPLIIDLVLWAAAVFFIIY